MYFGLKRMQCGHQLSENDKHNMARLGDTIQNQPGIASIPYMHTSFLNLLCVICDDSAIWIGRGIYEIGKRITVTDKVMNEKI